MDTAAEPQSSEANLELCALEAALLAAGISRSSPPPCSLTAEEMRLFLWQLAHQTGLCSFDSAPQLRPRPGSSSAASSFTGRRRSSLVLPPHPRAPCYRQRSARRGRLHTAARPAAGGTSDHPGTAPTGSAQRAPPSPATAPPGTAGPGGGRLGTWVPIRRGAAGSCGPSRAPHRAHPALQTAPQNPWGCPANPKPSTAPAASRAVSHHHAVLRSWC